MSLQRFISELRRRRVTRIAAAYAAAAFVLVQVTDLVVDPLRLPDWTMTLVILLVALGFPIALILSWALELTPDGVRRTPSDASSEGTGAQRRLALGAIVVVAVVTIGAATVWVLRRSPPATAIRSIAVLPFVDLSPAGDQRYFSDGLAEELTVALSRVDGLEVAARTAAFQFGGAGADLAEVGRRLNVTSVLEGSVRRADDRLRVIVRLVEVNSGYERWTRTYDRRVSDVFVVQEEIAQEVLNALRFPETEERLVSPGTENLAAYDHLLRGNHHLSRRTPEEVRSAIAEYSAAATADPRLAAALFRQAYALLIYADWGWSHPELSPEEMLRRAGELLARGLELDPASAEGWLARAYLNVVADPLYLRGALEAFERSLALDSRSAEAWHQYGQTLMVLGRFDDAAAAYHRALRVEPHRSMTLVPLAAMDLYGGRIANALRWADSAVAIDPANSYARASRARIHLAAGDTDRARSEAELAAGIDQGHAIPVITTLAASLARAGARDSALATLDTALAIAGDGDLSATDAANLAIAATALGDADRAIALLRRARPQGAWFWFYLQTPLLDPLRSDPRFQELVPRTRHQISVMTPRSTGPTRQETKPGAAPSQEFPATVGTAADRDAGATPAPGFATAREPDPAEAGHN
ncbi:MAG TPA: tetratricopeptide repeat protein [Longimicrobiales bacterium]